MKRNADIVREMLPLDERLAQLAEEAAELSQAALKLRRAIDGKNPTPITITEALSQLCGECADVYACLDVIGISNDKNSVREIKAMAAVKMSRWVFRLMESKSRESNVSE